MIAIFHNKNFWEYLPAAMADDAKYLPRLEDLKLVAWIDTDAWDEAYDRSQHLDTTWWREAGVTVAARNADGTYDSMTELPDQLPIRSTSTGDLLLREDGALFIVAPFGFGARSDRPMIAALMSQAFALVDKEMLQALLDGEMDLGEFQARQSDVDAVFANWKRIAK
jgi:hypothetical protein